MKDFTFGDYRKVLEKISVDKGTETDFEEQWKNGRSLSCLKHFGKGFFSLSERQQSIILFVLSMMASKKPNSGGRFEEMHSEDYLFENLAKINVDERKKLEEKFNKLSRCRNSAELMNVIKRDLNRFIQLPFNGFALIDDLNEHYFNDEIVLKKWLKNQFYKYVVNEQEAEK